ncbi:hypothetical protein X275_03180 [Marinitoga sp. 1197]|uniref:hypothetical protein n=1 Tax=Marinitoga sp. 1197 TaxID=1428449 RepID=UPI000640DD40|nr:hypothetical protein [Marinitoga sp. 1197]KLO23354.1 hypothetical protein X275_03180 [Marinitoga sp. 1197]
MAKKILILLSVLFMSIFAFGKLHNIYIGYNYDFLYYNQSFKSINGHYLYIGYNSGNIPLKIQLGTQNNLQFSGLISTFAKLGKFSLEPYLKYNNDFSIGIMINYSNFYFNYTLNKNNNQIFGVGLNIPVIKFGKDIVSYIESPDYIYNIAGEKVNIRLTAKTQNDVAENVDIFYSINNKDIVYIGKTNQFGEIYLKLPKIHESGKYKINIYAGNKAKKMKTIILKVQPAKVTNISFDFDKKSIFTDNQNILHIRNIKVYDKFSNEIKNYEIKFIKFKVLGDSKEVKYSYLDNTVILEPFGESGSYDLYYEVNVNGKYINGIKKIVVKNNPKNISDIKIDIEYLGREKSSGLFKIKIPEIYFLNSEKEYINSFFVYYNNKKVDIKNNIFKVPLNENFPQNIIFKVDINYYNYSKTIKKVLTITN